LGSLRMWAPGSFVLTVDRPRRASAASLAALAYRMHDIMPAMSAMPPEYIPLRPVTGIEGVTLDSTSPPYLRLITNPLHV
jgi:hypothetical protein